MFEYSEREKELHAKQDKGEQLTMPELYELRDIKRANMSHLVVVNPRK